jgi:hypothetical protein
VRKGKEKDDDDDDKDWFGIWPGVSTTRKKVLSRVDDEVKRICDRITLKELKEWSHDVQEKRRIVEELLKKKRIRIQSDRKLVITGLVKCIQRYVNSV